MAVGFTGSRSLPASFRVLVASAVAGLAPAPVVVGCAAGADAFVRSAAPGARVFRAASFAGPWRGRLAARSAAMVRFVAASPSPLLVGFVSGSCPAGLVPSPAASACFAGVGSGSWASLALAAGLGVPVVVFWCGPGPVALPPAWGSWVAAGGPLVGGWRLVPPAVQLSLL